jgi:hypothetical protein
MQHPLALNTTTAFPLAIRATRSYTAIAASASDVGWWWWRSSPAAAPDWATSIRIILSIEPRWWWWTGGEFLARQDAIAGEAVGTEGVDGYALL